MGMSADVTVHYARAALWQAGGAEAGVCPKPAPGGITASLHGGVSLAKFSSGSCTFRFCLSLPPSCAPKSNKCKTILFVSSLGSAPADLFADTRGFQNDAGRGRTPDRGGAGRCCRWAGSLLRAPSACPSEPVCPVPAPSSAAVGTGRTPSSVPSHGEGGTPDRWSTLRFPTRMTCEGGLWASLTPRMEGEAEEAGAS